MTILGAIIFALFTFISCGPPDPNKGACNCQEIEGSGRIGAAKKDGKLYTGICITRDQKDSITKRIEFKNGYTSLDQDWEEVYGNYVLRAEVTSFINQKEIKNGWLINFETMDGDSPFKYVKERYEYIDGKKNVYFLSVNYDKDKKEYHFTYKMEYNKGEKLGNNSNKDVEHPSCFKYTPSEYSELFQMTYSDRWETTAKNSSELDAVLECLKKELVGFNYYLPKK